MGRVPSSGIFSFICFLSIVYGSTTVLLIKLDPSRVGEGSWAIRSFIARTEMLEEEKSCNISVF